MEYPEGRVSQLSECNSTLTTLISGSISFQEPKIVVDSGTETVNDYSTKIVGDQDTSTLVNHGAQTDVLVGTQGDVQAAARPPPENLMGRQGKRLDVPRPPKKILRIFLGVYLKCATPLRRNWCNLCSCSKM